MQIAYNNDIEYNSRWYHIQTEDNGLKDGHITTTVFHSGQILDSKSVSYKENIAGVSDPNAQNDIIKNMMIQQHQLYGTKLCAGHYESMVEKLSRPRTMSQNNASSQIPPKPISSIPAPPSPTSRLEATGLGTGGKPGKPDILRASQQAASVQMAGHGIKSFSSLSSKPLTQPQGMTGESVNRVAYQTVAVGVSRAVETERRNRLGKAWRGFKWSDEDLAVDTLVVTLLENA